MPTSSPQHPQLAQGHWQHYSFMEQMANIGSEVERSFKWKTKLKNDFADKAFSRAMELLDLTIQAHTLDTPKLKELLRVKECLVDSFMFDNQYHSSHESWHAYFHPFNYAARVKREKNSL